MDSSATTIDVGKIINSKLKGKKAPRFVVRLVERFIHQDFINGYLSQGYEGTAFCQNCLDYLDVKIELEGLENLEVMGEHLCTFASNHPLGGVDGVALTGIIGARCNGNIRLMVNDFLMNIKAIGSISVPVNKMGGQSRNLPELTRQLYAGDAHLLIFPAGKCSRKRNGVIRDDTWKKTFLKYSIENGRWIVPVHFIGENSPRFYRVDRICKFLKIKFPLAMMFLPDELYRAQHKTFKVVFGKPIPPETFDSGRSAAAWAEHVMNIAYNL